MGPYFGPSYPWTINRSTFWTIMKVQNLDPGLKIFILQEGPHRSMKDHIGTMVMFYIRSEYFLSKELFVISGNLFQVLKILTILRINLATLKLSGNLFINTLLDTMSHGNWGIPRSPAPLHHIYKQVSVIYKPKNCKKI
jgi:hypothetical protein